jgi:hypothetical protein
MRDTFPKFGKVEYFSDDGLTASAGVLPVGQRLASLDQTTRERQPNVTVSRRAPRYQADFLRIVPDRQSNLATGRSICQSSTS